MTDLPDINESVKPKSQNYYQLMPIERGFEVYAENRSPTRVELTSDYMFKITIINGVKGQADFVGPYNFRKLVEKVVESLYVGYDPEASALKIKKSPKFIPKRLKMWMHNKAGRTLNRKVHDEWKRLVALIPVERQNVAKSIFRSTLDYNPQMLMSDLYNNHPYLVKDLSKYFSAATIFHLGINSSLYLDRDQIDYLLEPDNMTRFSFNYVDYSDIDGNQNHNIEYYDREDYKYRNGYITYPNYFKLMDRWRDLYSYNGKNYRALDITLDHITHVSGKLLIKILPRIRLERPIYHRLELTAVLAAYDRVVDMVGEGRTTYYNGDELDYQEERRRKLGNARLFQHADAKQVIAMMEHVNDYVNRRGENKYSHRKTSDIMQSIQFVLEYPELHAGNIVGLADKSIEWHREVNRQREEEKRKLADPNTPNRLPPIPLPNDEHIQFLSTIGDLFNESDTMDHCVYTYARHTISGRSFIFHVEYEGDIATIEIAPDGEILQSQGIGNKQYSMVKPGHTNLAITYGRRELAKWAKDFKKVK